jgi:hypothetical protein
MEKFSYKPRTTLEDGIFNHGKCELPIDGDILDIPLPVKTIPANKCTASDDVYPEYKQINEVYHSIDSFDLRNAIYEDNPGFIDSIKQKQMYSDPGQLDLVLLDYDETKPMTGMEAQEFVRAIDEVSERGNLNAFKFPRAILDKGFDFSFSGLKTAVVRQTKRFADEQLPVYDLAASFQAAVVDVLVKKTERAAAAYGVKAVHLAGGVSANRALRHTMREQLTIPVRYPPPIYCTDNAAMIGAAAHWHFVNGRRDSHDLDVIPSLQLV